MVMTTCKLIFTLLSYPCIVVLSMIIIISYVSNGQSMALKPHTNWQLTSTRCRIYFAIIFTSEINGHPHIHSQVTLHFK